MALLSFVNFVLLGVVYLLSKIVYQIVYNHFFHPLAKFPGPFWAGVTRLWLTYHNVKADECQVVQALHKKHGMHFSRLFMTPASSSRYTDISPTRARPCRADNALFAHRGRFHQAARYLQSQCQQVKALYHRQLWRDRVHVQHAGP